jgi:hypothetical protein
MRNFVPRLRLFREIRCRRDLVREVARSTLLVVIGADLIDLAINLINNSPYVVVSLVQTTFTATLMSALFLGAIARANLDLFRAKQELEVLSRTDLQTGLFNRPEFFRAAAQTVADAGRGGCLLIADVDDQ